MTFKMTAPRRTQKIALVAILTGAAGVSIPSVASACTPYGYIGAKWQQLYGDLGPCKDDEHDDGAGGRIQTFEYGYVNWIYPETQAYAVYGFIGAAWMSRYGGPAVTGQAITDEEPADAYGDRMNTFRTRSGAVQYLVWNAGKNWGTSCYAHGDNVCQTYGAIGQEWADYVMGMDILPIDEAGSYGFGNDQMQAFQNDSYINWNASNGMTCFWEGSRVVRGGPGCAPL